MPNKEEWLEYASQVKELNKRKPKKENSKQKFKRGAKIRVCKEMPPNMSHFDSDFEAIVEYTYNQKYGGGDIDSYSLIMLDENGDPINSIAWYEENQLTLIDNDIKTGLKIISNYENNLKKN